MSIKYEFPCYPGDEVWFISNYGGKPLYYGKDIVQMVGFTTRSVQIKLRRHKDFNKTFTWGKNVFATETEMREAFDKQCEEKNKKPECYKVIPVYSSDSCSKCKYSGECHLHFLTHMFIRGEEKR